MRGLLRDLGLGVADLEMLFFYFLSNLFIYLGLVCNNLSVRKVLV
jgi:hypothetical protein